jgi:F-type H+-transporting ATPase subunit b
MTLAALISPFILAAADAHGAAAGHGEAAHGAVEAGSQSIPAMFGLNGAAFLAQLIVFFIVFLILKKFAFGPITDVLEQRRRRIEQSIADADRIKAQLAEAEVRQQEILNQAHAQAKKLLDEAKTSSAALADRKTQEAIREAEQIISKANAATSAERAKMFAELKSELGALVVDTTALVTGKVLTDADKQRLNSEISRDLAGANS